MSTPNLSVAVDKLTPGAAVVMALLADVAVIRVAPALATDFNRTLRSTLSTIRPGKVSFGVFDRTQYKPTDAQHARCVKTWQSEMGWDPSVGVPDGYYLFHGGKLRAWHPPLADDDNADEQLAKAGAAGLGLIAALIFKSPALAKASAAVLESEDGKRAAEFFKKIILDYEEAARAAAAEKKARDAEEARRVAQAKVLDEQTARAFKTLGLVRAGATVKAAKKAWRGLIVQCHPDKGPATETEVRTKLTLAVNDAQEIVLKAIRSDAAAHARKTGTA